MIPPSPILTPQNELNPSLNHLAPISSDLLDLQEQLSLILQTIQSLRTLQSIPNFPLQNEDDLQLHWDLVNLQEALQPVVSLLRKGDHLGPIVCAGDHRTQGEGNDVQKPVFFLATTPAWIAQSGKTPQHRKHAPGHGSFALCLVSRPEKASAHNCRRRAFLTLYASVEKTRGCGNILWYAAGRWRKSALARSGGPTVTVRKYMEK